MSLTSHLPSLEEGMSRFREDLTCLACGDVMRDPVRTSCDHSFCKACFSPFSTCPVCGMYQVPQTIRAQITLKRVILQYDTLLRALGGEGEKMTTGVLPPPSRGGAKNKSKLKDDVLPPKTRTRRNLDVGAAASISTSSGTTNMSDGAVPTTQQINEWMSEEAKAAAKLKENAAKLEMLKRRAAGRADNTTSSRTEKETTSERRGEMAIHTTPADARTSTSAAPTQTPQKEEEEEEEEEEERRDELIEPTPAPSKRMKRSRDDETDDDCERIITTTPITDIPALIPVRSSTTNIVNQTKKTTTVALNPTTTTTPERVIVASSLSPTWAARLKKLIEKRNAAASRTGAGITKFLLEVGGKDSNAVVTHVVVGTEPVPDDMTKQISSSSSANVGGNNSWRRCKSTYKYFLGLSYGAWIVGESWIEACEKANAWVDESRFEVDSLGAPTILLSSHHNKGAILPKGPHKVSTIARWRRRPPPGGGLESGGGATTPLPSLPALFQKMDVLLGPFAENPNYITTFTKKQAKRLLELNGADVVDVGGDEHGNNIAQSMDYDEVPGFVMVGHPSNMLHENNECAFCELVKLAVGKQKRVVDAAYIMKCLTAQKRLSLEENEVKFLVEEE